MIGEERCLVGKPFPTGINECCQSCKITQDELPEKNWLLFVYGFGSCRTKAKNSLRSFNDCLHDYYREKHPQIHEKFFTKNCD